MDLLVDTQAAGSGAVQVAPRIRSIPPGVLSQTSTLSIAFQHRVASLEPLSWRRCPAGWNNEFAFAVVAEVADAHA